MTYTVTLTDGKGTNLEGKVIDTMSKGLTFNNDVKVTIKNAGKPDVDVTQYFWIGATKYDAVNGTEITRGEILDIASNLLYIEIHHPRLIVEDA